jgi:hypothetical protein
VLTPAKAGVFVTENFSRHNRGRLAKRPGFAGTASNDASILPPILNPNAFAGPVVESSLDEFAMHTAGRALAFSMFLHDYALRPAPVNDEPKTYVEVIAEMVVGSAANIEAVREMAERTGHPLFLDAFRELGYKVQRRHDAGQDRQACWSHDRATERTKNHAIRAKFRSCVWLLAVSTARPGTGERAVFAEFEWARARRQTPPALARLSVPWHGWRSGHQKPKPVQEAEERGPSGDFFGGTGGRRRPRRASLSPERLPAAQAPCGQARRP